MEPRPGSTVYELHDAYQELAPLDQSREVYLTALQFRETLGLRQPWDPQIDDARKNYAYRVSESINLAIDELDREVGATVSDIEDIIVSMMLHETERRWITYSSIIKDAGKEDMLAELESESAFITLDSFEKSKSLRASWQKYRDQLVGVDEQTKRVSADLRSEYVRGRVTWDSAKEDMFLNSLMHEKIDSDAA